MIEVHVNDQSQSNPQAVWPECQSWEGWDKDYGTLLLIMGLSFVHGARNQRAGIFNFNSNAASSLYIASVFG